MRIEQLEYLIEIAKTNSISIAAENLYVSQPSISEAIKKLEGELGIKLLERTKTGSYLTPIGKSIAEQAVRVIEETAKIHQLVAEHQKNEPRSQYLYSPECGQQYFASRAGCIS